MYHLRGLLRVSAVASLMVIVFAGPALAEDIFSLGCSELWFRRNSIFKEAGYCFHTSRAIRTFGNAGCAHDDERDVPLSDRDRRIINTIRQVEREKDCAL